MGKNFIVPLQHDMAGLYIHIPFCASRCVYCGFFSTTRLHERQTYVEALGREMQLRSFNGHGLTRTYTDEKGENGKIRIETVYLGGGTPSQLSAEQLRQLFIYINNVYDVSPQAEVTIECNPDDVTVLFVATLSQLPVNRVSMGAQTFSDARLRFLHRRHRAAQVNEAVQRLKEGGITNISVDLMYGFPDETLEEWNDDIDAALALGVEHLSAYVLSYEEGTMLFSMLQEGRVKELDEELQRQMYYMLKDRVEAAGYEHYELSNFARPGFRSRHNSAYWHHIPYVGIGAGAHSFDGLRRQWNVASVEQYIKAIGEGRVPADGETIDVITRYNERVMTALRTCDGLRLNDLPQMQRTYCLRQAEKYIACGWLCQPDNYTLRLTRDGFFVSDTVMSDLMADADAGEEAAFR